MGVAVAVVSTWRSGYKVAVAVTHWLPRTRLSLLVDGRYELQLLSIWGAVLHEQHAASSSSSGNSIRTFKSSGSASQVSFAMHVAR